MPLRNSISKPTTMGEVGSPCFSPIVDAHFDVLLNVYEKRKAGETHVLERDFLPGFRSAGIQVQICSLFISDRFYPEMATRNALDQIACLYEELDESAEHFALCRTSAEIKTAVQAGKIALLLSLEGAEPLGNDLSLLRVFYELGVRLLGLVWSRRNFAGDGAFFHPRREGTKGGLTDFGVALVEKAQQLGMVLDASHLNDEGFDDLLRYSTGPIIASHSNCRALAPSMRNLTDSQIKAIAARDGVIGLNGFSGFVGAPKGKRATIEDLILHTLHIADLVGAQHAGLGLDLCDTLDLSIAGHFAEDCDVLQSLPEIAELISLIRTKFDSKSAEMILGGNLFRVLHAILG